MLHYSEFILIETELQESFMDNIKALADKAIGKAKKLLAGLGHEGREFKSMMKTFFLKLKGILDGNDVVTDDDMKKALNQLGQTAKFAVIVPLFLMPGGGTTTALLYYTAKKLFNISILPKGLEQVFEMMYAQGVTIRDAINEVRNERKSYEVI